MAHDLKTIIQENPNLILQVTAGDLNEFLDDLIMEMRSIALSEAQAVKHGDRLLTIDEAAKALSVSKMTLYRWHQAGILRKVEIGGKRRYRRTDVERLVGFRLEEVDYDL